MNSSDRHRVAIDRHRNTELVASYPITRGYLFHLTPVPRSTLIALEDVGRARLLAISSDHHCVTVDRYRVTEMVVCRRISCGEFLHLSPVLNSTLIALEDIGRASVGVLRPGSDHHCVGVDRYR